MQRILTLITAMGVLAAAPTARAEWVTESYALQPGWNAIHTLHDCTHVTLDELLAPWPSVTRVWRWVPTNLTSQFIGDPTRPVEGQEWRTWIRGNPAGTTMTHLAANHGCLVYNSGPPVTLVLKGRAVLNQVQWRSSGANLVGFPAATGTGAPRFGGTTSGYFAPLAASGYSPSGTRVFQYGGGEISALNPAPVPALTTAPVLRGKAYWVDLPVFTDFASPVRMELTGGGTGMDWGSRGGPRRLVVTNASRAALTVSVAPVASETPPAGQPSIAGSVPLLQRVWQPASGTFGFVPVTGPLTASLAAGAAAEWTLAPDRAAMAGPVGSRYASVLRITDSGPHGSYSLQHVPLTAERGSAGGLWVGDATVTHVQNHLQRFLRNPDGSNVLDQDGQPVRDGPPVNDESATAQSFPLRLIFHVDTGGHARLLSTIHFGPLDTDPPAVGYALREARLRQDALDKAVRLTAAHLPLDTDAACTGTFGPGAVLAAAIAMAHTDPVNPFLHTYHPDHDNRDARFGAAVLPPGRESRSVNRAVTFRFDNAGPAGDPAWGSASITGTYAEVVTGLHRQPIAVSGRFTLRRLSEIATPPLP